MKRKLFVLSGLIFVLVLALSGGFKEKEAPIGNPYYSDEAVKDYYNSLPKTIIDKYDVGMNDMAKLSVDFNKDYTTSEQTEFLVFLDADPVRVGQNRNYGLSEIELKKNVNEAFKGFYNDMNVDESIKRGYLGLSDINTNSDYDVEIHKTYEGAVVGLYLTAPAEYAFHMIGLDNVASVIENSNVSVDPVDINAFDSMLPEHIINDDTYTSLMDKTNSFLGVDTLQDLGYNGLGINVAVLDTGIDWTHPALLEAMAGYEYAVENIPNFREDTINGGWQSADNSWLEGWGHRDFVDSDFDPMETTPNDFLRVKTEFEESGTSPLCAPFQEYFTTGHGSHVAGTILSRPLTDVDGNAVAVDDEIDADGNPKVVQGIATKATLYGIRTLGHCGSASLHTIVDSANYIAEFTYQSLIDGGKFNFVKYKEDIARGISESINATFTVEDINIDENDLVIDVANMSLGGGNSLPTTSLNVVVNNLSDLGVVVATAAGNSGHYGDYTVRAPGAADKGITVGAAPIDYYVEQAKFNYDGKNYMANMIGYSQQGDSTVADIFETALDNRQMIFAEKGKTTDLSLVGSAKDKIVVLDRGDISFWDKFVNSKEKGAIAIIILNYDSFNNDPIYQYFGKYRAFSIPLLTIDPRRDVNGDDISSAADLRNAVKENSSKLGVTTTLDTEFAYGTKIRLNNKTIAEFSSMGPNYGTQNIKPDIIAPGVDIYSTIPNFYNIAQGEGLLSSSRSYTPMQGTSMATPHIAGIAALMVQKTKYELMIWDDPSVLQIDDRAQLVKISMMNTANHDMYSQGEYEITGNIVDVYDYSVYKKTTGGVNPQRALAALDNSKIYVNYTEQYEYLDSSKEGTSDPISTQIINNIKTGLISYGLIIGNDENDPTAEKFHKQWEKKTVTIDNTMCSDEQDKYYNIEFLANNSKYSNNADGLRFTVTNIVSSKGVDSTSNTIGEWDLLDEKFMYGANQGYFIRYLSDSFEQKNMYVHVPCGEKIELTLKLAKMNANSEKGFYEGYFKFNELLVASEGTESAFEYYNPTNFNGSDFGSSEKMHFVRAQYEEGNDIVDYLMNDKYKVSSLPMAFKYATQGAEFSFWWPMTSGASPMDVEFYNDIDGPVRVFIKQAITDEDGEIIFGADGKPQTELLGAIDSVEFPTTTIKGYTMTTNIFSYPAYYTGGACDINSYETEEDYYNNLVILKNEMPEGCELKALNHGLYEFEVRYAYLNDELESVPMVQNDLWFMKNNEKPNLTFETGKDKFAHYSEPNIYTIKDSDYDENGFIWVEGVINDKYIDLMNKVDRKTMLRRKYDQGNNWILAYVNDSAFPGFIVSVDIDGTFKIGITKKDIQETGRYSIMLDYGNLAGNQAYPYNPKFTFVNEKTVYYSFDTIHAVDDITIDTVQGINIYANNFSQIRQGRFSVYKGSSCGVTKVEESDELKEIIAKYGLHLKVNYVEAQIETFFSWELIGDDFNGLSGNMSLFKITYTAVCEEEIATASYQGLGTVRGAMGKLYLVKDIYNNDIWIPLLETTEIDQTTWLPKGTIVKYNKSFIAFYTTTRIYGGDNVADFGVKVKATSESGKVYYGKINVNNGLASIKIDPIDGMYKVEVEAIGYLPYVRYVEVDHRLSSGEVVDSRTVGFNNTFAGEYGDINNDGMIDAKDAYYMMMLDKDIDSANLSNTYKSTQFRYSAFKAIVMNFGKVSGEMSQSAEISYEYGGYTMYDMAMKMGFENFYFEDEFPNFDYIKVDKDAPLPPLYTTCRALSDIHDFLLNPEILDEIDGSVDGIKDGVINTCELNKVTEITLPKGYENSSDFTMTFLGYLINVQELNIQSAVNEVKFRNMSSELTKLQINNSNINNSDLYNYTNGSLTLKTLIARDNELMNIGNNFVFYQNTDLETVDVSNNMIRTLDGIEKYTLLENLYVANNSITDLTPLRLLNNLKVLDLSGNNITDLSPLANSSQLEYLILDDNQIYDLSPLKNLNRLKVLSLKDNEISDISPISEMPLESLNVAKNKISNSMQFEKLSTVKYLYIQENQLTEISGLKGLENLVSLNIDKNKINLSEGTVDRTILIQLSENSKSGIIINAFNQIPILEIENDVVVINVGDKFIDDGGKIVYFGGHLRYQEWETNVIVEGTVDTSVAGIYEIKYHIIYNGVRSETITRTVYVLEFESSLGIGEIIK